VEPTSTAQFEASKNGSVPPLEQLRDDVFALAVPMPRGHIPYSFQYLLKDADGGIHVIDPGWETDDNWQLFVSALATMGAQLCDVRSIVATHLHPDHLAMAARMREATGAPLALHHAEQDALDAQHLTRWSEESLARQLDDWQVPDARRGEFAQFAGSAPAAPSIVCDTTVADGDRLDIPGFDLTVMWTPGHTHGSICLRDDARSIMFTGDHLLPTMHPGLGLGGPTASNALSDYLDGLERISRYPAHEALPGHGYRFAGLADRANQSAEHHLRRSREVAQLLESDPQLPIWQIASRLTWTAGWQNLTGFFVYSALSQTSMHRDYVALQAARPAAL
jgi:glyoxylase-like metal-dependent hydrolase (beta-lactamase superfamily II)